MNRNSADMSSAQQPCVSNGGIVLQQQQKQKVEIFNPAVKPDADGDAQAWFATKELHSDLQVEVGDTQFHLHKFPLLSRSGLLNKLVFESRDTEKEHMKLVDMPGGADAFAIAAKFCYGLAVDITTSNVAALRCAAEYLEMKEELEEGNLSARTESFLCSAVLASWTDSIAVLRSCSKLLPWAENLQIVQRCIESIAWKACTDMRSLSYSRTRSIAAENPDKTRNVSQDWWLHDVCCLSADYFVRTVNAMKAKGMRPELIGAAVVCYSEKRLPNLLRVSSHGQKPEAEARIDGEAADKIPFFCSTATSEKGETEEDVSQGFNLPLGDMAEDDDDDFFDTPSRQSELLESLLGVLPLQNNVVSMEFLLQLLRAANLLGLGSSRCGKELEKILSTQLEEVSLQDLLPSSWRSPSYDSVMEVDIVSRIVQNFVEYYETKTTPSRMKAVAIVLDGYLAEIAKDPKLPLHNFEGLVDALPQSARLSHDSLYKAMDNFLMAHPDLADAERQRLFRRIDLHRLSAEASQHASQNERLPLCAAVQVLFAEHVKLRDAIARAEERSQAMQMARVSISDSEGQWMSGSQAELRSLEAEVQQMRVELMGLKSYCAGLQQQLGESRSRKKGMLWWEPSVKKKLQNGKKFRNSLFMWC